MATQTPTQPQTPRLTPEEKIRKLEKELRWYVKYYYWTAIPVLAGIGSLLRQFAQILGGD